MSAQTIDFRPEEPATELELALSELRTMLEQRTLIADVTRSNKSSHAGRSPRPRAEERLGLKALCSRLSLSAFDRHVLLLCAGAELDSRFGQVFSEIQAHPQATDPTFALAFNTWGRPVWEAVTPSGALRRWSLVKVPPGESLLGSPLALDERILFYLLEVAADDVRIAELSGRASGSVALNASQRRLAADLAAQWQAPQLSSILVQVSGATRTERHDAILAAAALVARPLRVLRASALSQRADHVAIACLLERESHLTDCILYVEVDTEEQWSEYRPFVEALECDVVFASRAPLAVAHSSCLRLELGRAQPAELRDRWRASLGAYGADSAGCLGRVSAQFHLEADDIVAVGRSVIGSNSGATPDQFERDLWQACRIQSRRSLDGLAQRVQSNATWNDLVLPESRIGLLRDLLAQVRNRTRVYEDWGFAQRSSRGLGITALFSGESGTGKTLAAEVLANQLCLDLFKVDLSRVVSKYIGETEKNLNRLFDAADECGAVLLFDEADALFGKRTEVRDSHDRYANLEVSFLLQRMESYRGLAILTTNRKSALDTAFTRRIRFVVEFPFPDARQRAAIWQRAFPESTPTDGLDPMRLAGLSATGGQIANVALAAAFMAADANESVTLSHVVRAARNELSKVEKLLTESDLGGLL